MLIVAAIKFLPSLSSPLPIDSKRLVQIMALNMFVIEHAKAKSSLGVTGGPAFKGEIDIHIN